MQQHRLRVSGQEVASGKTWGTWWVERLEQVQRRITKLARGLVNTAYGDCSGSWVCPAWRQEGSGKTLLLPATSWWESEKNNQTLCRSSQWKKERQWTHQVLMWCLSPFNDALQVSCCTYGDRKYQYTFLVWLDVWTIVFGWQRHGVEVYSPPLKTLLPFFASLLAFIFHLFSFLIPLVCPIYD